MKDERFLWLIFNSITQLGLWVVSYELWVVRGELLAVSYVCYPPPPPPLWGTPTCLRGRMWGVRGELWGVRGELLAVSHVCYPPPPPFGVLPPVSGGESELWVVSCELWVVSCELWAMGCGVWGVSWGYCFSLMNQRWIIKGKSEGYLKLETWNAERWLA